MTTFNSFEKDGHSEGDVHSRDVYQSAMKDMYEKVLSNHHKIAIAIINDTDQDLRRVADAFAVGRWEARAPYLIPKGYVGVMGVTNRDNEPRGVRGLVLYEGADCVALCGFDNPYVGSHKSMARVQDRGCWTYFDGLTRIAAGVPDQAWEQLDAKGGQAQHTTRKGQQYTLTAQGHSDGDVRAPYGHLEFTLTQAQGPTRA